MFRPGIIDDSQVRAAVGGLPEYSSSVAYTSTGSVAFPTHSVGDMLMSFCFHTGFGTIPGDIVDFTTMRTDDGGSNSTDMGVKVSAKTATGTELTVSATNSTWWVLVVIKNGTIANFESTVSKFTANTITITPTYDSLLLYVAKTSNWVNNQCPEDFGGVGRLCEYSGSYAGNSTSHSSTVGTDVGTAGVDALARATGISGNEKMLYTFALW